MEPNNKEKDSANEGDTSLRVESDPPPTITDEEKAPSKRQELREWGTLVIEIVGLIGLFYYACTTTRIWRESQRQTSISQQQLEVTDRPWLKISFTAEGRGFYFREDGTAELSLRTHIRNIGHSVATGVVIPHEMFLPSDENGSIFNGPMEHQKRICDAAANKTVGSREDQKQQNEMLSMVIFPDDTDESQTIGMVISKADIDARKTLVPEGPGFPKVPGGKRILPVIVGCVDYEFGTSTHHHQTGFIYEVQRRIRVPPNVYPFVMIDIAQQVSPSDVVLTKYGFGGFSAN